MANIMAIAFAGMMFFLFVILAIGLPLVLSSKAARELRKRGWLK